MKALESNRDGNFWILIAVAAALWSTHSFAAFKVLDDGQEVAGDQTSVAKKGIINSDESIDKESATSLITETIENVPVLAGKNLIKRESRSVAYPYNPHWPAQWAIEANDCISAFLDKKVKSVEEIGRFWLKVKSIQYEVRNYEKVFEPSWKVWDSWPYESDASLRKKLNATWDRKTGVLKIEVAPILNDVGSSFCNQLGTSGAYAGILSLIQGSQLSSEEQEKPALVKTQQKPSIPLNRAAERFSRINEKVVPVKIAEEKSAENTLKPLNPESNVQSDFASSNSGALPVAK